MDTEIILNGYTKEKIYFNMLWVNIFSIIVFAISVVVFGGLFYLIWYGKIDLNNLIIINKETAQQERVLLVLKNISIIFIPIIVGIVLHELIHGFFYVLFAKNKFKSIKFGVKLKYGVAYCICTELVKIKHFFIVTIMPTIILGFIPIILSFFFRNIFLLFLGILFITCGAGDFWIILRLRKEGKEDYVLDTIGEINCINIYRKISN
jgi:hypothetical protein